jgi:hypothetical protein
MKGQKGGRMLNSIIADPFSFEWKGEFYKISCREIDWQKKETYVEVENVITGKTKLLTIPDPEYHKKTITDLYEAGSFEQEVLSEFMFLSLEKLGALEKLKMLGETPNKNKEGDKNVKLAS